MIGEASMDTGSDRIPLKSSVSRGTSLPAGLVAIFYEPGTARIILCRLIAIAASNGDFFPVDWTHERRLSVVLRGNIAQDETCLLCNSDVCTKTPSAGR